MNSPINIVHNCSLQQHNTLGLSSTARYYVEVNSTAELRAALAFARQRRLPVIPLGGGSNVVLAEMLDALVVRVNLLGKEILQRTPNGLLVRAAAGENWHDFVLWTLANQAYGLENLSLIPGTVGAAPIQNIGAYGVELRDYFVALDAMHIESGTISRFDGPACCFGYRDSVFKGAWQDQYIIISVSLKLDAQLRPKLDYGQLRDILTQRTGNPQALDISQAVCDIRRDKLPDPQEIGNAGSFFKNPVVSAQEMARLKREYSDIVAYPAGVMWKLAAGWLIDRAGLRGLQQGTVGTYRNQALVLVNHGGATGRDVLDFATMVQRTIDDKFGVQLECEPRFYGTQKKAER